MIQVLPGDENAAADALNGVYEKHRQLKPGDTVIDLGAHKGYFASVALEKIGPEGRIICFEPHPENFRILSKRIQDPRAILNNYAAWNDVATLALWESVDNDGAHSWVHAEGQKPEPIEVRTLNIGLFLRAIGIVAPDFVKIDTELSEGRIIKSLMTNGIRPEYIAAEIHSHDMWHVCTETLKSFGYHITPGEFKNYYLYAWP